MPKLTKSVVDKAEVRSNPYFVWCSSLSGFGVRIFPSGKKVYYVDYRADGQRRRMNIGPYGKITTDQARDLALKMLGGVVKGEDPLAERRTRRKSVTIADLCDQYVEAAGAGLVLSKRRKPTPKKASTLYVDRGRIERHIKPLLGSKRVAELTPADVKRFMDAVTIGKTAKIEKTKRLRGKSVVRGGAGTAARTVGLLGGILSFGHVSPNPVHGVMRPADGQRTRRLSADEYRAIGDALKAAGDLSWQATAAIRLLALTGARRGEIAALRWSEIDSSANVLRLGDTKTGASTRPLAQAALDVLECLPSAKGAVYVFPGLREPDKPFGALPAAVERIMASAGLEGVTAHTLRHSFASVAGDLEYSDSTIGAMLGHAGNTITSKYIHRLDPVLLAAANKVAAEVHRQMTGMSAKVIEMPRRA